MNTDTIPDVALVDTNVCAFNFHRYLPHPALRPYVEYYYIFQVRDTLDSPVPQTLVPLNHPLLLFNTGADLNIRNIKGQIVSLPESIISGFCTESARFVPSQGVENLGVFFRPQGMKRLLNVPMDAMANRAFDACVVLDNSVKYVLEKLQEEHEIQNRLNIIDSFLLAHLSCTSNQDDLVSEILYEMYDQRGLLMIRDLSKKFQISRQYLYRIFNRSLGVSPKVFGRLLRFHHLLNLIKKQPNNNWHDVLYSSGFYDQAHMIREFTSIVGQPPTSVTGQNLSISDFYIQT